MNSPLDEFCEKMEKFVGEKRGEFPNPEFRRNLRALAAAMLTRMNLVSREEFDAQSVALARAVERMEELEKQIRELRDSHSHPKPKKNSAPKGD